MDFVAWMRAFKIPPDDQKITLTLAIRVRISCAQKLTLSSRFKKMVLTRAFRLQIVINRCRNTVWWFRQNFRISSLINSELWIIEIWTSVTTMTKKTQVSCQLPISRYNKWKDEMFFNQYEIIYWTRSPLEITK